ncbi:MAG: hypothetical protein C4291_08930 [Candidatus Dadabacteria bacterium]
MIRRDERDGWILINQHDHAELSGEIMKYWGNKEFIRPDSEVLFAIGEHDNGWKEWDSCPKINPISRYPMNFLEMSPSDQSEIWRRCFRRHSADHPYASALIALHFGKLNEKSLNKNSNNGTARSLQAEITDFVSGMLNINIPSLDLNSLPKDVQVNLRFVQIADIISLTLCHGWLSIGIEEVPLGYNGSSTTLNLKSTDGSNYVVSPYPFSQPLIELQIEGRRLGQKRFTGDAELREMIEKSQREILHFSIRKE